jgi:hypothetical protein
VVAAGQTGRKPALESRSGGGALLVAASPTNSCCVALEKDREKAAVFPVRHNGQAHTPEH